MKHKDFYAYVYPKNLTEFDVPKIIFPDVALETKATYESNHLYLQNTAYGISLKTGDESNYLYYLGIINNPLFTFFVKNTGTVIRGWYLRFNPRFMNDFPIAECSQEDQDKMSTWVRERLQLQKDYDLIANPTPSEIKDYESDTKILERKINKLVYTLYKLSADEIRMIEVPTSTGRA